MFNGLEIKLNCLKSSVCYPFYTIYKLAIMSIQTLVVHIVGIQYQEQVQLIRTQNLLFCLISVSLLLQANSLKHRTGNQHSSRLEGISGYQWNIFLVSRRKHTLWYSLVGPRSGASNEYHNMCFCEGIRQISFKKNAFSGAMQSSPI